MTEWNAGTRPAGRRSSHRVGLIIAAVVLFVCGLPVAACGGVAYKLGLFGPNVQPMLDELAITAPGIRHMTPDGLTVLPDWRHGRREMIASVSRAEFQAIIEREFAAKGWKRGRCQGPNAHLADSCWVHDGVTAELLMEGTTTDSEATINGEAR